jgi:hypothetical protein
MDEMQAKIEKLEALQAQIRHWRIGGVATILVVVGCCLWHVREQTVSLFNDGPRHDLFMAELKSGLVRDAVPEAKKITAKTIDRLGPILQKELVTLERRMPEFTKRAEEQMNLLREELPERAERAMKPTVGKALEKQLAAWHKQYPKLTPEQLESASTRLANEVDDRMANVAAQMIVPVDASVEAMIDDLGEIRKLEAGHDEIDTWDLAVVSLGLVHEELAKLDPQTRRLFVASLDKKETK